MKELTQAVIDSLRDKKIGKEYVANSGYLKAFPIDDKNYCPIGKEKSDYREFSFIDGGQAILFESPSIAAGFLKIGQVSYDGTQRISKSKDEFQILVKRDGENFLVRTFPATQFDGLVITSESIMDSNVMPQTIISLIRRCMEFELASQLKNPVLDGALEAKSELEIKYISKLSNALAFSKTCSFSLNTGESIIRRLSRKEGSWYYYPVFEDSRIYFVKLHDKSRHVFRLDFSSDIIDQGRGEIEDRISSLKSLSNDPIFLGYPYGLVDVDQYVRVSDEEKEYMKIKLFSLLGKEYWKLSSEENSMNAHSILDNIRF
ncbi:MAG TPA: hypothetical protein VEC16_00855 [Alphaproteobacteria bacterium]|nr:hypothetical protein [Alphaproteobacteria bacterium]